MSAYEELRAAIARLAGTGEGSTRAIIDTLVLVHRAIAESKERPVPWPYVGQILTDEEGHTYRIISINTASGNLLVKEEK